MIPAISLFGVQGFGKSYTLGTIAEMATMPIAGVNVLPEPLAALVFHYHRSESYPPEFSLNDGHTAHCWKLSPEWQTSPSFALKA